jgi:hypothetical protein
MEKLMIHNRNIIDAEMNFCRVSGSVPCGLKIKMCLIIKKLLKK